MVNTAPAGTDAARPVVLAVDDEPGICNALRRCLRPLGVEVLTAPSGADGLSTLEAHPVDVIISDMRMPGMSGAQFLKAARERYPKARRILLTGYAEVDSAVEALNEGGISSYISKPWDDARLREVVAESLETVLLAKEKERLEALTREQNAALQTMNEELERRVAERTQALRATNSLLERTVAELSHSYETMVNLLASAEALRDPDGLTDIDDKRALARSMARALGCGEEDVRAVEQAMQLHRLGRMGLEDKLLQKRPDTLGDKEREAFEKHPVYAEALLMGVPQLNKAATFLRNQHERMDGTGYPSRRGPESIPLGGRILAVARDYYDLLAGRGEKQPLEPVDAVATIKRRVRSRYDAEVVEAFEKVLPDVSRLDTTVREMAIASGALRPGMQLSRDLLTPSGLLLFNKQRGLTESVIDKIRHLEDTLGSRLDIHVLKEESDTGEEETA